MIKRILIVGVGLIVLIIAFVIIKGLVSGGGNSAAMLIVVQDQQELIHLSTAAAIQPNISSSNKNFALTTQLVITSEQSQLRTYLAKQGQKITLKQRNLKISSAIDSQLTSAITSNSYDTTFQSVMKSQLTNYATALQVAYKQSPGTNARKLLTSQYNSAVLLQQQLSTAQ